jgi:phosphopantothenoylcysteine synthetase/decarboxylase
VNLHDWSDELCDLLDVETEADESLLGDLAEVAHDNVHPAAGPVTAFLIGVAAGAQDAGPEQVERMAAKAQALAEAWDRPAGAAADDDRDDEADDEVDEELSHLDEIDEEEEEDLLV